MALLTYPRRHWLTSTGICGVTYISQKTLAYFHRNTWHYLYIPEDIGGLPPEYMALLIYTRRHRLTSPDYVALVICPRRQPLVNSSLIICRKEIRCETRFIFGVLHKGMPNSRRMCVVARNIFSQGALDSMRKHNFQAFFSNILLRALHNVAE
jgi:hypothetical protein